MRTLLIHNRYQERGGEDGVFEAEQALLRQRGHEVLAIEFDNHAIFPSMKMGYPDVCNGQEYCSVPTGEETE